MKQCYMRFPGGKKKAFTISYDDNITQDERLIKKMEQYHIKGTFNIIPGWFSKEDAVFPEGETYINVTEKKAKDLYDNSLVEVANHGYDHQKSTTVPTMQLMEDLSNAAGNWKTCMTESLPDMPIRMVYIMKR